MILNHLTPINTVTLPSRVYNTHMATTTASKKAKGTRLEHLVAERIEDVLGSYGIHATRTPMSGAIDRFKGDIFTNLSCSIECKNQEKVQVWKWWEQARADAKHKMPVLVMSRNREKRPVALVDFEDLLFLMELALQKGWSHD